MIGETPVERDDGGMEGGKNERAFTGGSLFVPNGFVTAPLSR